MTLGTGLPGAWVGHPGVSFQGEGPQGEIVLTSRVRLARNLEKTPFPLRLTDDRREAIREAVFAAAHGSRYLVPPVLLSLDALGPVERQLLLERHLISHELLEGRGSGVATETEARIGVLVNEEDHLRFSSFRRGLDLMDAFAGLVSFLREIEGRLPFAFDRDLGYLTACPTNLGTGLRASALLHLPGLLRMGRMRAVAESAGGIGMLLRGTHGEGSEPEGALFQLSNRITLGHAEIAILERTEAWIREIVEREGEAREELFRTHPAECEDRIFRSEALLGAVRLLSTKEASELFSWVLLGIHRGILRIPAGKILAAWVLSGDAHLQVRAGRILAPTEREAARAAFVRERFR